MKYEIGDKITVLLTNEDGIVVEIMSEKMVMIEVKGVRFPAYVDQIDFPYFKMFTNPKPVEKKKIYIDNVQKEKKVLKTTEGTGVRITFIPIFDKDIFDDEIVEKFKIYLINQNNEKYKFNYHFTKAGNSTFNLINTIEPLENFYLHDVLFEELSDNPRFDFEFSVLAENNKKAPCFETSLKLKAKQLFKKIEELQIKNEPNFSYVLFENYPDSIVEEKVDLSKLGNAGFKLYDVSKIKQNLLPAKSVIDLHIEKLTDTVDDLSSFDILTLQLNTFEKYYELAVQHFKSSLVVIHGVGEGKLRNEIHEILRLKKEVKSFVNQYHHLYGYGATEIFFEYKIK